MLLASSRAVRRSRLLWVGAALAAAAMDASAQSPCVSTPTCSLFPSDAASNEGAGAHVAMNASGSRVVLSAVGHGHGGVISGAAWVFSNPGTTAQTEVELIPSGATPYMDFGCAIAMNAAGDLLVVGAPGQGAAATWPKVFVFRDNGTSWVEEWHADGTHFADQFGLSVTVCASGEVFAAGAPLREVGGSINRGSVEVFRRHANGWVNEATILPADATGSNMVGNVIALSADGNLLAIRAFSSYTNGAVYLYEHSASGWSQVVKLLDPVAYSTGGFGMAIALDSAARTLALGNFQDSRQVYQSGAVSIFSKGTSGWVYETVLLQPAPATSSRLGETVALNAAGDRLLAGAPAAEYGGVTMGAVHEFLRTEQGWQPGNVYYAPGQEAAGFGKRVRSGATGARWVAGEPWSDAYQVDGGRVVVFDSPCTAPAAYCTAMTNSLGCVAQIGSQGTPSASSASGFTLSLADTRNQQSGLLFYGTNGRCSAPWRGGTLCVQPPLVRTPLQNAAGNPPPLQDCTGAFALDFNAWVALGSDPALFPGQHVRAQYWSRDPGSSSNVNLSDALEFYLEP